MRNYEKELAIRTAFIRSILEDAGAAGIVYGNSGGKDSALVGALCKAACPNTVGIILPCGSKQNYGSDRDDALLVAKHFGIDVREIDLTAVKEAMLAAVSPAAAVTDAAKANISPRLRMTSLYAVAQSENRLVAGTGNYSEYYAGYFTKWGDGAYDLNPIADLTVTEIYEFLRYLGCPARIIEKAPSAGLFDGQTDEKEMGLTYAELDRYILTKEAEPAVKVKIEARHSATAHKRRTPCQFGVE
ncbi:MAG: NAD(+) synthase [Clostridia bacterium]|nr:NAD(+) synthase [Clostridia bacterium]